ncbi:SpoIIE family protein phosphatase [Streptomyces sp. NPDC046984]|uniref:SpoIIE family protein phosphatase n=1 Tax=Streptomyces sp. NPDC046984 TaxID=3155138 RepID=UPI0033F141D3
METPSTATPKDPEEVLQSTAGGSEPAPAALLTHSSIGLALFDAALHCTWANDALEQYDAIPRIKRLGRRPETALSGGVASYAAVMRQVLATGTPVIGRQYRVPADDGGEHHRTLSFSCLRLDDADGRTSGVALMVVEVTGGQPAADRLSLLSEAGARIGTTLDVTRTAGELAAFTVPLLADFVTVDLADTVRLGEEPLARLGADGEYVPVFRRAGLASIHPGAPESLFGVGDVVYVPPFSPLTQVLSTERSYLEPVLDRCSTWLTKDPARARTIRERGIHSLMVVPIRARGVILGVTVFVRTDNRAPFDPQDLLLAEELVARAALSLDNARRYTHERATALALQRGLLPRAVSGGPDLEVVSRSRPADLEDGVGGDWYDVIPLNGGRVALVVGDVTGHGINAAATMGRLRTAVRTLADLDLPPHRLMAHLDQAVIRLAEEEIGTPGPSAGATCLYAVYDPATRRCTVARAGHPPPAILRPGGSVTFPGLPNGTPLGLGVLPYRSAEVELAEGSTIALYTDGLIEDRQHDIDTGIERLRAALDHPGRALDVLCSEVLDTLAGPAPSDDVTLLLARTSGPEPGGAAGTGRPAQR